MVMTNFECWANGGTGIGGYSEPPHDSTQLRRGHGMVMFNPRVSSQITVPSNGYYGYVNVPPVTAQEQQQQQQLCNSNPSDNNNNTNANNNNNTNITNNHGLNMGYDVNCGNATFNSGMASDIRGAVVRCKKRFHVDAAAAGDGSVGSYTASDNMELNTFINDAMMQAGSVAAKRCRYDADGDDMAAQYCHDFFASHATQIGTQSCLMDIEEQQQQQQQQLQHQQVDATMSDFTTTAHVHTQESSAQQQQQTPQQQSQQPNHQQHHYQGHLHRANRDVSRCMLSHMI